jgi:hypothetical protein
LTEIPIQIIRDLLFSNPVLRQHVMSDFGIGPTSGPGQFSTALVEKLDQSSVRSPETQHPSHQAVFQSAVFAIASGGFSWSEFLRDVEPRLRSVLSSPTETEAATRCYDPEHVAKKADDEEFISTLANLLRGTGPGQKAEAVIKWADLLSKNPDFYRDVITATFDKVEVQLPNNLGVQFYPVVVLCMSGIFSNPIGSWSQTVPKFPGMRVPIACEFLRNLGWDAYKPDTHVMWAIEQWLPHLSEFEPAVAVFRDKIIDIIESRDNEILKPIEAGLYAVLSTPIGPYCSTYSEADNLLWAFTRYARLESSKNQIFKSCFAELANGGNDKTHFSGPW